jgi:proline iminopeptidase
MQTYLYPKIEPYSHFYHDVSPPHRLYVEECGNPKGLPVIFIHGGPGAGCSKEDRRFFNPDIYRVILFDQRGCNRSTPLALLENNTTDDLISDIESIRTHLNIKKWIVFGGSWGSTLSLLYAETYPAFVLSLVLRGIFLGSEEEFEYLNTGAMSRFYPEEYLTYKALIPQEKQNNLHLAYYDILKNGSQPEKFEAARRFTNWDMRGVSLATPLTPIEQKDCSYEILAEALIQCHYMVNNCFLKHEQIIRSITNIIHIPTTIVHGRYDMLCAPEKAYALHQLLPHSKLFFTQKAGHASRDEGTIEKLVEAMDKLAETLNI